jgi:hypothetical protein
MRVSEVKAKSREVVFSERGFLASGAGFKERLSGSGADRTAIAVASLRQCCHNSQKSLSAAIAQLAECSFS